MWTTCPKSSACLVWLQGQQISISLLIVSAEGMLLEPVWPAKNKQYQMGSRKLLRVFVINLTQCKYCMFSTMFFNSLRWVPNCRRGLSVRLQRHGDWLWVGASHSVAVVTIKSARYSWTCSGLRLLLLSFDVHPVMRGFGRETHRWRGECVRGTGKRSPADFPSRDLWLRQPAQV